MGDPIPGDRVGEWTKAQEGATSDRAHVALNRRDCVLRFEWEAKLRAES